MSAVAALSEASGRPRSRTAGRFVVVESTEIQPLRPMFEELVEPTIVKWPACHSSRGEQ
jgi:hypothetical protein